jgi:hypothetical protein
MREAAAMRWWAISLVALTMTGGCERARQMTPKFSDHQMREMRAGMPGMKEECLNIIRWEGLEALSEGTGECFEMTKPAHWRGLWRDDFEGSRFCPSPATKCVNDAAGEWIWLTIQQPQNAPELGSGALYEIDFVGRRTAQKGEFGHMGAGDYEMIVDRLNSIKMLEPPPPQPTKAQAIADMKACEAQKTCIPNWEAINQMEE